MEKVEEESKKQHFMLVHGGGHGAWCWYKLVVLLEAAGHRVTALDLAGCGVHPKRLDEVESFRDYMQPLTEALASLPPGERVVLVGHSFGGVALSLALEAFPDRISAAVFATACILGPNSSLADIFVEKFRRNPLESMLDCRYTFDNGPECPTTIIPGPEFLSSKMYHLCSPEDVILGSMLVRPMRLFLEDTTKVVLTEDKFRSVPRVYVVCKEDLVVTEDLQRCLVDKSPVDQVMEIEGADHMVMLSKPLELFRCLEEVVKKYA